MSNASFERSLIYMSEFSDIFLSPREYEIMRLFWQSKSPMCSADIIDKSPDRKWSKNSLHQLLNSLEGKNYLLIVGKQKATRTNTRLYKANITLEEYIAAMFGDIFGTEKVSFNFFEMFENYFDIRRE